MKRTTQSPVSIGAEEIITSNLYIDGVEIGTAMLPKLVHRTSLSPIVVNGKVEQRQFYTLHNDAGKCVFVSPALQDGMNKKWTRPWRWNWRTDESWHLHPVLVPEGSSYGSLLPDYIGGTGDITSPDGPVEPDVPTPDDIPDVINPPYPVPQNITDISWWYATDKRKSVVPPAYDGYNPKNILLANHTWEKSGLLSYSMDLPKCTSGIRMFAESNDLTSFTANDFKSLQHGEGMFEKCEHLTTISNTSDIFTELVYGSKMFKETSISSFNLSMPKLTHGTEMFYYCTSLASCSTQSFPELTQGAKMFYYCDDLKTIDTTFPKLQNANEMYRGCTLLSKITGSNKFPNLTSARYMFRDCVNFVPSFDDTSFPLLEDGQCMFDKVSNLTKIPCKFPSLKNARQMFMECNISGHLDLDMPRDFPNVKTNSFTGGNYPTAYMFGKCPITSISFDVSTCDHCISMFNNCTQLTSCTKAVFMNGGNYQSMFSESMFDETSADIIIAAARAANVSMLHIGMNSAYRNDNFKSKHGCQQKDEGYDDQWIVTGTNIIIKWN